jgi:hypothetical protein
MVSFLKETLADVAIIRGDNPVEMVAEALTLIVAE